MATCPACGRENRDEARFCDSCGAPVTVDEIRELRKVVTILFCDVTGSTSLGEQLDSETLRKVMERYFAAAREVLERHGGSVEKFIGDAVMAVFGVPAVHEDDALRAARAASELRDRLVEVNVELKDAYGVELAVRIGINTGEVVTSAGGTLATGDAVNVAARLEQSARPNEILIGERTRELAEGALELEAVDPIEAKGKSEAVRAYRLLAVRPDAPAFARRFDAPFVGRENELAQLRQAFAGAVNDRSCHLFTLLGPAGIGKSRLTYEFLSEREDAIVLRGRCLAYGEGITYFPLVEVLEELAAEPALVALVERDPEARRLLNTVSSSLGFADQPSLSREETFHAIRKLLEALAREQSLILLLDDIHWAEPTFLDLIDHLADWSRDVPILLLCLARPDLLDGRPGWGGGKLHATTTLLEPLSDDEAETLIDNLLHGADLPAPLRERIAETAEGNPLFVEQMLALLAQDGQSAADIAVPPTIQALLATRLEQLPTTERVAAERASVIGKEFWRTALMELGGDVTAVPALVRKELVRPYRSPIFPSDDAFRFRHLLIRDAAYDGIPKELRAQLHERFARWLELHRTEYDEIVGYHFEQAYRLREQLGPIDGDAQGLATSAGELLARAGRRAYQRGDISAATNLLTRATALLPESHTMRLEALLDLGYALHQAAELARSIETLGTLIELADRSGAPAMAARARIAHRFMKMHTGGSYVEPVEAVRRDLALLEELRDESGLAEGWSVMGILESWLGRSELAGGAFDRAIGHARAAGNRRLTIPLGIRVMLDAWGHRPAEEGLRACDTLLGEHRGTSLEPFIRAGRARYLSITGDAEGARRETDLAGDLHREFGSAIAAAGMTMNIADQELRAGRPEEAEAAARDGVERLERYGETGFLSSTAGFLAEALYRQGKYDEAEECARRVAELSAEEDFDPQIRWRVVQAKLLARGGEFEQAEALGREAVEIGERTDWYEIRATSLVGLADVLELAGRVAEAGPVLEAALELYERKGATVDAAATRRKLDEVREDR